MRSDSANRHDRFPMLQGAAAQRGGVRSIAEVITELWTQYRGLLPDDETIADLCRAADLRQPAIR